MTRGAQGWTSPLMEFTQVSALTFHLLIHQNYEFTTKFTTSEPSPWRSLEVFQPQPFHATQKWGLSPHTRWALGQSAGRRGGFLGEVGAHFSQMGPNIDFRGRSRGGGGGLSCWLCSLQTRARTLASTAPASPAAFPQFWGCWTYPYPAKPTLPPKRAQEQLHLTCPSRRWVLPSPKLGQAPSSCPGKSQDPWFRLCSPPSRSLQHPAPAELLQHRRSVPPCCTSRPRSGQLVSLPQLTPSSSMTLGVPGENPCI